MLCCCATWPGKEFTLLKSGLQMGCIVSRDTLVDTRDDISKRNSTSTRLKSSTPTLQKIGQMTCFPCRTLWSVSATLDAGLVNHTVLCKDIPSTSVLSNITHTMLKWLDVRLCTWDMCKNQWHCWGILCRVSETCVRVEITCSIAWCRTTELGLLQDGRVGCQNLADWSRDWSFPIFKSTKNEVHRVGCVVGKQARLELFCSVHTVVTEIFSRDVSERWF